MTKGIYIIGTDTEVGKTVVAAGLMYLLLEKGYRAAYFKPVATGEMNDNGARIPMDAAFVRTVSGFKGDLKMSSVFSFADEVAPHLAARMAGRRIAGEAVFAALADLKKHCDIIVGEGAGGLMVPLNDEGLAAIRDDQGNGFFLPAGRACGSGNNQSHAADAAGCPRGRLENQRHHHQRCWRQPGGTR